MISAFFHGWNNVMVLFAIFGVVIFIAVIMCVMRGRRGNRGKTVAFEQEVEVVKEVIEVQP